MNSLKVKINIAGRHYPLTIQPEEEEAVRNAGKEIARMIQEFEDRYAVTDKQDAIAMVALQMTSKYNLLKSLGNGSEQFVSQKLNEMSQFIEKELEK